MTHLHRPQLCMSNSRLISWNTEARLQVWSSHQSHGTTGFFACKSGIELKPRQRGMGWDRIERNNITMNYHVLNIMTFGKIGTPGFWLHTRVLNWTLHVWRVWKHRVYIYIYYVIWCNTYFFGGRTSKRHANAAHKMPPKKGASTPDKLQMSRTGGGLTWKSFERPGSLVGSLHNLEWFESKKESVKLCWHTFSTRSHM